MVPTAERGTICGTTAGTICGTAAGTLCGTTAGTTCGTTAGTMCGTTAGTTCGTTAGTVCGTGCGTWYPMRYHSRYHRRYRLPGPYSRYHRRFCSRYHVVPQPVPAVVPVVPQRYGTTWYRLQNRKGYRLYGTGSLWYRRTAYGTGTTVVPHAALVPRYLEPVPYTTAGLRFCSQCRHVVPQPVPPAVPAVVPPLVPRSGAGTIYCLESVSSHNQLLYISESYIYIVHDM